MTLQPHIARLKSQLAVTGLQKKDNALFQVINGLIKALEQSQAATAEEIAAGGGGGVPSLANEDYLTHSDESVTLPNSRNLIAGTNIIFDDSVPNQRTIEAAGSPFSSSLDFLTHTDESASLPNSRNLLAGVGVGFDDSVPNERTINFTGSVKGAQVYRATDFTLSDNVATAVILSNETIDENNYWDVANPTRIIIPESGWYAIIGQAAIDATQGGIFEISIRLNGITKRNMQSAGLAVGAGNQMVRSTGALLKLTAGDYLELVCHTVMNVGGITQEIIGGENNTFIQISNVAVGGGGGSSDWDVLSNGDLTYPELIFADGEVIMLEIP